MSRKDSKGLFANVLGKLDADSAPAVPLRSNSPHLMKVAAGVRQLQERGELAERLLRDADHIVEIDPESIQPSPIPDRFEIAYGEPQLADLMESMRTLGQSTPGLVRPVSDAEKPFQIVFGRRRLAAAKLLGIKFKAIVRELSDEDAVVLQGDENSNRNDLSYIERCMFAHSQETAGYDRNVICTSLSTGKSHVSEMIRIASSLPRDVVLSIGPAVDVGRRRWIEFEAKWSAHPEAGKVAAAALKSPSPESTPSEVRFQRVLDALSKEDGTVRPPSSREIVSKGIVFAQLQHAKAGSKLAFTKAVPTGFADYVASRLEQLHDEYLQQASSTHETRR